MEQARRRNSPTEIYTIEALRGLAAVSVAWFHLTNQYPLNWVRYSGEYCWLGVEVFFVISGFIIPYSLEASEYTTDQFGRFMLRRIIRLEPPYLVSILLVITLSELSARAPGFLGQVPSYSLPQIAVHFLYLVPLTSYDWLSVVYWTLAYEFVFYILIGLFWPLLRSMPSVVTPILFLVFFGAAYLLMGNAPALIFLFLVGIAGARYYIGIDGPWTASFTILFAIGVLWLVASPAVALAALATILTILFVKIPRLTLLTFLGGISYSLYLIHVPVGGRIVNLGRRLSDGAPFEFILSLVALGVTVIVTAIYFKYIESPAKQASKKISVGKPSPQPSVVPVEIKP